MRTNARSTAGNVEFCATNPSICLSPEGIFSDCNNQAFSLNTTMEAINGFSDQNTSYQNDGRQVTGLEDCSTSPETECSVRRSPRLAAARLKTAGSRTEASPPMAGAASASGTLSAPSPRDFARVTRSSSSVSSCSYPKSDVFNTSLSPISCVNSNFSSEGENTENEAGNLDISTRSMMTTSRKRKSPMMSCNIQDTSTCMACPDTVTVAKAKRKKRKQTDSDGEDNSSFFDSYRKKKRRNTVCTANDMDCDTLSMSSFNLRKHGKADPDYDTMSLRSFSLRSSFRLKRKSKVDLDTLSLQSFSMGTGQKRNRSMVKVGSLANLMSPVSSVKKVGQALQRSMSFKGAQSGAKTIKPYCKPPATPTKRRDSKLWSETVKGNINEALTKIEIKRQEAIFELFQGEVDLVEDLYLVMKAYRDSMRSLQILTEEELNIIFGSLDELREIHEALVCSLQKQRRKNGTTGEVGKVLLNWLPSLTEVYVSYCTKQLAAKTLLDEKKQDSKVNDFLERCIESPFSRKLDLWNFLDVPRSRLVKYPLLFKNILRVTPSDHEDKIHITEAISLCEEIVREVDRRTGETKCKHCIDMFEYLEDSQRNHLIPYQKVLLCGGVLKSTKGTKRHVFLFEDILVVTRLTTRNNRKYYQVYEKPIPVRTMALEDIPEGEVRRSGSFRGALSHGQSVKCGFKVRSTDPSLSQTFTLHSSDEHDKKQWLQLLRSAIRRARQDETCV